MKDNDFLQSDMKELTEKDIRQWLSAHPEFFEGNQDVLDMVVDIIANQKNNKPKGDKKIADFQSYFIERLKADKQRVLATTQEIVETSRANMTNQSRIQECVIRLLDAQNLDDLVQVLTMDLAHILGVDICSLVVEIDGQDVDIPHIPYSGVRLLPEGTIDQWMDKKRCSMQSNISGIEAIYGGSASLIQSQLLLRLEITSDTPPALVAFGSRDPDMFEESLGTENILFLAGVIERCLKIRLSHISGTFMG